MRFAPTTTEQETLNDLPPEGRFHYAVTRICECEEVWGLGGEAGWRIRSGTDADIISIWPYRQMALDYAREEAMDCLPVSVSLEHFLYSLLKQCSEAQISLEVNPAPGREGALVSAVDLYEVLENQVDSGSYFLDG